MSARSTKIPPRWFSQALEPAAAHEPKDLVLHSL